MVKKDVEQSETVPIKVRNETRRKLNIIGAKRDQTVDQVINHLIDFEYKETRKQKV